MLRYCFFRYCEADVLEVAHAALLEVIDGQAQVEEKFEYCVVREYEAFFVVIDEFSFHVYCLLVRVLLYYRVVIQSLLQYVLIILLLPQWCWQFVYQKGEVLRLDPPCRCLVIVAPEIDQLLVVMRTDNCVVLDRELRESFQYYGDEEVNYH